MRGGETSFRVFKKNLPSMYIFYHLPGKRLLFGEISSI